MNSTKYRNGTKLTKGEGRKNNETKVLLGMGFQQNGKQTLPFLPTYQGELYKEHVTVIWFPKEFSQSYYNRSCQEIPSNACTLIAVFLAAYIQYNHIQFREKALPLDKKIAEAIAHSMLTGNETHRNLLRQGSYQNVNFTVPEAVNGGGKFLSKLSEWEFHVYNEDMETTLYRNLCEKLCLWNDIMRSHHLNVDGSNLFVVVISEQRSILLVVQFDTFNISLFDSHQHLSHGAVMAHVQFKHLRYLCKWYADMQKFCFSDTPKCYELSFLYFKKN